MGSREIRDARETTPYRKYDDSRGNCSFEMESDLMCFIPLRYCA